MALTEDPPSIPAGWEAGGLWRSVDRFSGACGTSSFGRKAMGYTSSNCDYATGSRTTGTLTSPAFSWSNASKLSFAQWAQTEQYSGYDVRKVSIRRSDGYEVQLAQWSGPDTGGPDSWVVSSFDIGPYYSAGTTVQLKFTFDSVDGYYNNYRGWFIDDIEVDTP